MEPVQRVEEKPGAHAFVEVAGAAAELVERGRLGEQVVGGFAGDGALEREVAEERIL
jgi:hypothetical protein